MLHKSRIRFAVAGHELTPTDMVALIVIVGVNAWAAVKIALLYGGLSI